MLITLNKSRRITEIGSTSGETLVINNCRVGYTFDTVISLNWILYNFNICFKGNVDLAAIIINYLRVTF